MNEGPVSDSLMAVAEPLDVVDGLARLFVTGGIYPPGHPLLVKVSSKVTEILSTYLDATGVMEIVVHENTFGIEAEPLLKLTPVAQRLHRDLDGLGIERIELRQGLTQDQLLDFVSTIREVIHASVRRKVSLSEWKKRLPPRVQVVEREFGPPSLGEASPSIDVSLRKRLILMALAPLDKYHIDDLARNTLQRFLDSALDAIARALPDQEELENEVLERADLLALAAEALRKSIEERLEIFPDELDLNAVFEELSESLVGGLPDTTASVVMSSLRSTAEQQMLKSFRFEVKGLMGEQKETHRGSQVEVSGVNEELKRLAAQSHPRRRLDWDSREYFGALLQLLPGEIRPAGLNAIRQRLTDCLASGLPANDFDMVAAALEDLFHAAPVAAIDAVVPVIARVIRQREPDSMADFLIRIEEQGDATTRRKLWPHLANELFEGLGPASRDLGARAIEVLASIDHDELEADAARLAPLSALNSGSCSNQIIAPPVPRLYPFYAAVVEKCGQTCFLNELLTAFQRCPPAAPSNTALDCLDAADPRARRFLVLYLRHACDQHEEGVLLRTANQIISQRVRSLRPRDRKGPWVQQAIEAVRLCGNRSLLEEILSARSSFLLPVWPSNARRAARLALKNIRLGPASDGRRKGRSE